LYLSKENRSCGDLTARRERENGAIGHADVDRTVDGSEREGAQRRCCWECSSGKESFDGAERGATVEGETVTVVAGFRGIPDGIATTSEGAIGTAGGSSGESVSEAFITFLSGIDRGVPTGRTEEAAGGGVAGVGEIGIVEPRLTDFIEGLLNDAITTEATFEETGSRATVTVSGITIIAFLGRGEDTVTADGSTEDCRSERTGWGAEVIGRRVTLLGGGGHAIAAGGSGSEVG
jgi:hypothetical protein